MDNKQISEMTGESQFKKAPEMKLNDVGLNGQKGFFVERLLLEGKDESGKYTKKDLGKELKVVFLKHRRVLSHFKKGPNGLEVISTNEHNHKDDYVMLFGPNIKGKASDLREKYQELRTKQIVYSFLPELDEVVRLTVKGASLGSNNKQKEVLSYYEYLASFSGEEHSWQYYTILKPREESNDMGSYYTIEFVRGEKISEDELNSKIIPLIKNVHEYTQAVDNYYKSKNEIEIKEEKKEKEPDLDTEYPDEVVNADDIPF